MQIKGENWFTCSLVYPCIGDLVLLGLKQQKLIALCRVGPGGRVEDGESLPHCAVRETEEETGILIAENDLSYRGLVFCHNKKTDGTFFTVKIFVYTVSTWIGTPRDTDEMSDLRLFFKGKLPAHELAPGDEYWLPRLLRGEKVIACVFYDIGQKKLMDEPFVIAVDHLPPDR